MIPDGQGGAFVGWRDLRDSVTNDYDTYLQHLDANGAPLWESCGIALYAGPGFQNQPHLTLDGEGGVIAAWVDFRNGAYADIYAQRVNASGQSLWQLGGVRLGSATLDKYFGRTAITSDGFGGAIVAWDERVSGINLDIWAQRISSSGAVLWSPRGKPACRASGFQLYASVAHDGQGGAYVVWEDWRQGSNAQIYAQRLNSAGSVQWEINGILISPENAKGLLPVVVSDNQNGAIVGWHHGDVHGQRLGQTGPIWAQGGVVVCGAGGLQGPPNVVPVEACAAVFSWSDQRSAAQVDVYAQKVDSLGTPRWTADGVLVTAMEGDQKAGAICSDGAGGAILTWADYRPEVAGSYVQRIDTSGLLLWEGGLRLSFRSEAGAPDGGVPAAAGDGLGSAVIVWTDNRDGIYDEFSSPLNLNLYSSAVSSGTVGVGNSMTQGTRLFQPRPTPMRSECVISFELGRSERVALEVFSVDGRRVRTLLPDEEQSAGVHEVVWNGRNDSGMPAPTGIYVVMLRVGSERQVRRAILVR